MDEEILSNETGSSGKNQIDSWDTRICKKFFTVGCEEGDNCPQKHVFYTLEVVCKFFLMYGQCNKGSQCPFIHEIVSEKLPECKNQTSNSKCLNPQCKFKHSIDKEIKECIYYNSGFCKMGKFCKFKHERRELCRFVSEGQNCEDKACGKFHYENCEEMGKSGGIFEEYLEDCFYKMHKDKEKIEYRDVYQLCFRCMQFGHHPSKCNSPDKIRVIRCYKCMKYGHKSNQCTTN